MDTKEKEQRYLKVFRKLKLLIDDGTSSEIAVPVFQGDRLIAVYDVDSVEIGSFGAVDRDNL